MSATVQDFARHYSCSILPARPQRPQDKAKVESAVQVVERWIMMRLRHQRFETVDEVNAAIVPLLEYLNTRPFQKLPGSRATAFAQLDAPALQPLPAQSWELVVFKSVRVHIDQHVEFEGHRYSVPTALVRQEGGRSEELRIRNGNGKLGKWLIQLAKTDVLVLDDWGMTGLDAQTRADLLEIIDDWSSSIATVITSNYRLSTGMPGLVTPPLRTPC